LPQLLAKCIHRLRRCCRLIATSLALALLIVVVIVVVIVIVIVVVIVVVIVIVIVVVVVVVFKIALTDSRYHVISFSQHITDGSLHTKAR